MILELTCDYCDATIFRKECLFARSGPRAFCNRKCTGLWRRLNKSPDEKKAEKAAYDRAYREKNHDLIKAKKSAYFQRTYDPEKARVERKANMARHVEYCRRPEYRAKKHAYDIGYNARRNYGSFGEAFILLQQLENEVGSRMSDYEIRSQQGALNKAQQRKRDLYAKNTR